MLLLIGCTEGNEDDTEIRFVDPPKKDEIEDDDTVAAREVYRGAAEAGPMMPGSEVKLIPMDSEFLQTGEPIYGGTKYDYSGSFAIFSDVTADNIRTIATGPAYNETSGGIDTGVILQSVVPGDSESFNANHFSSISALVGMYWFHELPSGPYYQDPQAFVAAEAAVLDYFDYSGLWGPASINSYEMKLTGTTLDDAKMTMINSTMSLGNNGWEQNMLGQQIAQDIYLGLFNLKAEINSRTANLKIKQIIDNMNGFYASYNLDYRLAPIELLPDVPDYYADILNNEHIVLDSDNIGEVSACMIDTNEYNSFAYPKVFNSLEDAKYYASELTGDLSLHTVTVCDNGTITYPCPGTKLLDVEELREVLLPGGLRYNGKLGNHSLASGQYFEVQNFTENTAPAHTCTGEMNDFGTALAAHDNDWNNAVGPGNTHRFFTRKTKSQTWD